MTNFLFDVLFLLSLGKKGDCLVRSEVVLTSFKCTNSVFNLRTLPSLLREQKKTNEADLIFRLEDRDQNLNHPTVQCYNFS